jgi:hypothetical protein
METIKKAPTSKDETAAVEQPQEPNHTQKIKSQVLAKIGKLPRLDHVAVSWLYDGNYRVNVWQQPEPNKDVAITSTARIRSSYYLKVSDSGEIVGSNPPLTKLCSLA